MVDGTNGARLDALEDRQEATAERADAFLAELRELIGLAVAALREAA